VVLCSWAHGRFDDALASCEQVLARKPDHLAALLHSSDALAELDRMQEALKRIESARSLAPLDSNIAARGELSAQSEHRASGCLFSAQGMARAAPSAAGAAIRISRRANA
jgi:tetratricopeptide (TPR) repeat protein